MARGYQEKLTPAAGWAYDNVLAGALDKKTRAAVTQLSMEMNGLGTRNGWPDIETARRMAEMKLRKTNQPEAAELIAKIDPEKIKEPSGAFYTADLPDEMVDRMLDWDASIKSQPENIRNALQPLLDKHGIAKTADIGTLISAMGRDMPQSMVSEKLRNIGIPGIRYLDAGSRGQGGSGTRNFVVFPGEEKKVKILRRE